MNLIDVHSRPDRHDLLYALLMERDASVNISHKEMPRFEDHHVRFVESMPYAAWYFIVTDEPIGSIYLSRQNEIGVFLFKAHWGNGYGRDAITLLMQKHGKRRYLANINPLNNRSRKIFTELGFTKCQETYECVSGGA